MVEGEVTQNGVVQIRLEVADRDWLAVIDTGFNSGLELPVHLFDQLNPVFVGSTQFELAAGQIIEQDVFVLSFPFDGEIIRADATFVEGETILIGTGLMRRHRLTVDFVAKTVLLERVAPTPRSLTEG